MGEYTSVVCDGDDCYKTLHDTSADSAHEENYLDHGGMDSFVTAFKKMPWHEVFPDSTADAKLMGTLPRWQTYCRDCAESINLAKLRRDGWKVRVPEGFIEGQACDSCSYDSERPFGYLDNGEPFMVDGKMNPARKQWRCEDCKGEGWATPQVARTKATS